MVIYQILMTSNFLQRSPRWMKYLHMEVMTPCVVGRFRDGWGPQAKSSLVWYDDQWSNQQFFAKIVLNIEDVLYLMEIFLCPDIQKSIVLIPETNNKKGYLLLVTLIEITLSQNRGLQKGILKKIFFFKLLRHLLGQLHQYLEFYLWHNDTVIWDSLVWSCIDPMFFLNPPLSFFVPHSKKPVKFWCHLIWLTTN